MSLIGKSIIRKEDPILIKGRGLFTDDFSLNDVTFAKFVLSEHPHANLKSIDISKANKLMELLGSSQFMILMNILTCQDLMICSVRY